MRRPTSRLRGALLGGLVGGALGLPLGGLWLVATGGLRGSGLDLVVLAVGCAIVGGGVGLPVGAVVAAPRGRIHEHDAARRALRLRTFVMAGLLALGAAAPLVCLLLAGPLRDGLARAVGEASPFGLGGASARLVLAGSIHAALAVAFATLLLSRPERPALGLPARLGTATAGLSAGFFGPLELALAFFR